MSRSSKKGPWVEERLMQRIEAMNESGQKQMLKTWSRTRPSSPRWSGHTIAVHDGRKHVPVFISESMVGHKLGEFAPTRVFRAHAGSRREKRDGRGKKKAPEEDRGGRVRDRGEAQSLEGPERGRSRRRDHG